MEITKMINLTKHPISLIGKAGITEIPPSGKIARIKFKKKSLRLVEGLPVPVNPLSEPEFIEGLPDPQEGTVYLVSRLVITHIRSRPDVFAPDTSWGSTVRNNFGDIVGVTRLFSTPEYAAKYLTVQPTQGSD